MTNHGYKKYMKKNDRKSHPLIKIFIISFFGMLLLSTFIINSVVKRMSVDTSIGDYKEQSISDFEDKKGVDSRLELLQNEDNERNFSDIMKNAEDKQPENNGVFQFPESEKKEHITKSSNPAAEDEVSKDIFYKVYVGSYTSAEQAKVAKEIIQESGSGFNPIVKCIGLNNYTLQVGIFKNKQSAEAMLISVQNSNLPGRIVKEN